MLVYPEIDRKLRERYVIQGHAIDVCTMNLDADWRDIRRELLLLFYD